MGSTKSQKMEWLWIVFGENRNEEAEHGSNGGAQVGGVNRHSGEFYLWRDSNLLWLPFLFISKKKKSDLRDEKACLLLHFLRIGKEKVLKFSGTYPMSEILCLLLFSEPPCTNLLLWCPLTYASPELSRYYVAPYVGTILIPFFLEESFIQGGIECNTF